MKSLIKIFFAGLLFVSMASSSSAFYSLGDPQGFVNDYADVLDEATESRLESDLMAYSQETKHQIAVVTIESLQGDTIENFSQKIFDEWGIGTEAADNGVLLLLAVEDRQVRIAVGYGLEGVLPDLLAKRILSEKGSPAFKAGDYGKGVTDVVNEVKSAAKSEVISTELLDQKTFAKHPYSITIHAVLILLFIVIGIYSFVNRKHKKKKVMLRGCLYALGAEAIAVIMALTIIDWPESALIGGVFPFSGFLVGSTRSMMGKVRGRSIWSGGGDLSDSDSGSSSSGGDFGGGDSGGGGGDSGGVGSSDSW